MAKTTTNEKALYTTSFDVGDYFKKTYKFDPSVRTEAPIPGDMPYNGFTVAVKNAAGEGEMKSCLKRDANLPFEQTVAAKIINDPNLKIGQVQTWGEQNQPVMHYIVICENRECSIFRPTATIAPSESFNVRTDFEVEMLFAFEDEYLIPIRKKASTHGPGAYKLIHVINDMLDALDTEDAEEIVDFFEKCQGVQVSEQDGEAVMEFMASTTEGTIEAFHLELDRDNIRELIRSLVSVRLISCEQTIDGE